MKLVRFAVERLRTLMNIDEYSKMSPVMRERAHALNEPVVSDSKSIESKLDAYTVSLSVRESMESIESYSEFLPSVSVFIAVKGKVKFAVFGFSS